MNALLLWVVLGALLGRVLLPLLLVGYDELSVRIGERRQRRRLDAEEKLRPADWERPNYSQIFRL